MPINYRQIKAIEQKNKARILKMCPYISERPGIYVFTRFDGEFRYAYVGQAKHLLSRVAQHLSGYQHIDLSIKKHGLWSEGNPFGWRIDYCGCSVDILDEKEKEFIKFYANGGYQLYNHTIGGQGKGKRGLGSQKSPKGYRDGLKQGYLNAQKEIANLFAKHLNFSKKSDKPNKNQDKALEKFKEFLDWENNNGRGQMD